MDNKHRLLVGALSLAGLALARASRSAGSFYDPESWAPYKGDDPWEREWCAIRGPEYDGVSLVTAALSPAPISGCPRRTPQEQLEYQRDRDLLFRGLDVSHGAAMGVINNIRR